MIVALLLAAAPAPSLQPAGKWVVSYNEADCTLQRSFGDAARPTVFGFKPAPTQISGDLVLLLPGPAIKGNGRGTVTLEPGGQTFKVEWARGPLANERHGIRMEVERPFWEALERARDIRFDVGEDQPVAAALGTMEGAFASVRQCGDDLLRHWGADPAHMVKLDLPETAARWFTANEYPSAAVRAGEQGRVSTLTLFDQRGSPERCIVVKTSGSLALDQKTCSIMMRRARVPSDPAAVARRFVFLPVRWILP